MAETRAAGRGDADMATLGPELFDLLNRTQRIKTPVIYGRGGMSAADVQHVEAELGFRLPKDFSYFLQNVQDPGSVLFPWAAFNIDKYNELIGWVLHGIEFDVEHNKEWLDRWGKRPRATHDALELARRDFSTWPKLLPIFGHRFLAAEPCREGNPVFSIMQTDIIYYGADLANYLEMEFLPSATSRAVDFSRIKQVPVWSDFAENREPPVGPLRGSAH